MNQGVRLTALYAAGCGAAPVDSSIGRAIVNYLETGQGEGELWRKYLGHLEPRHYYHWLLEAKYPHALDDFHPPIVRDYWLGNAVLLSPLSRHCSLIAPPKMNPRMNEKSFSPWRNAGACIFLHQGVRPYHNFVVLAKMALSGLEIPAVLGAANNCIISSGVVRKVLDDRLIVDWRPLIWTDERLRWGKSQRIKVQRDYVKEVRVGDIVSLHYGEAREVLTETQQKRLAKYTQLAIDHLNRSFAQAKRE